MNPYSVLMRPIISEKSNKLREESSVYTFQVRVKATKDDIAKAVKAVFNVEAESVRTVIQRGKVKRKRMIMTKAKKFKKAFITLPEGQKLKIFEEA